MLLAAFLLGLVLVLAGAVFVVVRGIGLWRQTKRTGRALGSEVTSFEERATRAERHLSEWESSSRELELALDRLRISQARLRVLLDSVEHAQSRVRWIRVFVPR